MPHSTTFENIEGYFFNDQTSKLAKEANLDQYTFISSFSTSCYYCSRLIFIQITKTKRRGHMKYVFQVLNFLTLCYRAKL